MEKKKVATDYRGKKKDKVKSSNRAWKRKNHKEDLGRGSGSAVHRVEKTKGVYRN